MKLTRKRAPRSTLPAVVPVETDALFERIVSILEDARARVVRSSPPAT